MDYEVLDFYQGTDDNTDPSIAIIQVMYQGQPICFETGCQIPVEDGAPDGSNDNAADADLEAVAQVVLANCPATIPNPTYDPTLTACWS
jgi:hypothetical protein